MKTKQIVKELALLVGAALGIFLVLVLIAWVRSLTGGTAVFLLSGRLGRKRMKLWENRFPHVSFDWALILVGAVLIVLGCAVNYIVL